MITDEADCLGYNVDWIKSVRGELICISIIFMFILYDIAIQFRVKMKLRPIKYAACGYSFMEYNKIRALVAKYFFFLQKPEYYEVQYKRGNNGTYINGKCIIF